MGKETVSIIVPIYKGRKYIVQLIDMAHKNYNHLDHNRYIVELILINDFPDDELQDISESCDDVRVTVKNNRKNEGIHKTRINGLMASTGEYILFLDQDDRITDSYLESQIGILKDHDAVICNGIYRNDKKIFPGTGLQEGICNFAGYLKYGYPLVSLGQLMVKREKIPGEWILSPMQYNGWDDHFLWAIMMYHKSDIGINRENLYVHVEDGNNASLDWNEMILSGLNFKSIFQELGICNEEQKAEFDRLIDCKIEKYRCYYNIDELWKRITDDMIYNFLIHRGIKKLAVYGMGIYGKKLYLSIRGRDIEVKYGIDQRTDIEIEDLLILNLSSTMEKVDVIIVTAVFDYENIRRKISGKVPYPCISLYELLKEIQA